jgi:predicted ATP-binding protein involved in virulence
MEKNKIYKGIKYENSEYEFIKKCMHNISNFKTFSTSQLEKINQMSYEARFEILTVYNEMITFLSEIMNEKT